MKQGDKLKVFGCTWVVDDVYDLSDEEMEIRGLRYKTRYKAHAVETPDGYMGITELDAALV